MTVKQIFKVYSVAEKSVANLKILYNPEIDHYGVLLEDDDGDKVLICLNRERMNELVDFMAGFMAESS